MAKPKKRPRQLETHSQDQPITDLPLPDDPAELARLLEKIYQQEATLCKAYDESVCSHWSENESIALRRQIHDLSNQRADVARKIQNIHFPRAQMPWSMTPREFFELPINRPDLFIYPDESPTPSPHADDAIGKYFYDRLTGQETWVSWKRTMADAEGLKLGKCGSVQAARSKLKYYCKRHGIQPIPKTPARKGKAK